MKVKFNLPTSRYNSKFAFDYNTTSDFGNLQCSFSKLCVPKAKFSIDVSQLVRTAPLVVPTFGRMAVHNLFSFVPMSMIMPSFDAFISQTKLNGTKKSYTPQSLPVVTNNWLTTLLFSRPNLSVFAIYQLTKDPSGLAVEERMFSSLNNNIITLQDDLHGTQTGRITASYAECLKQVWDYRFLIKTPRGEYYDCFYKLTNLGRSIYNVLRGLGYSLDYNDVQPVSALPILAYCKAVYDILYPKRDTPYHVTKLYSYINNYYNGDITNYSYNGHDYDFIGYSSNVNYLTYSGFIDIILDFLIAPIGRNLSNIATATPILQTNVPDSSFVTSDIRVDPQFSSEVSASKGGVGVQYTNDGFDAQSIRLADKLWSFVQRSSVVGQDVKNWFKVHFGSTPTEDMFNQSYLIKDVVNQLNINTVVSTAETSQDGGEVLGGLAGQSYSGTSDKVSFEAPNFGYLLCLTYVVPICRVSSGTQPELYNASYFDMPFPDFDGLGYEALNNTSFQEFYDIAIEHAPMTGFGFVPRLTSYKTYNNVRSGGFALPSLRDNYLPYCLDNVCSVKAGLRQINEPLTTDNVIQNVGTFVPINSSTLAWYYPYGNDKSNWHDWPKNVFPTWRVFDTIFYNTHDHSDFFDLDWSSNNFMMQTSFEVNVSSYLKPLSDSYSIENLGNQLTSVEKE